MLTRLKVNGFKNLINVDVSFGEFTCIAGPNGSGKSNLFDAIMFLSHLADKSLLEAAQLVRDPDCKNSDIRSLFFKAGDSIHETMEFEVEMIIPKFGIDDLGQKAEATTTFLTYKVVIGFNKRPSAYVAQPLMILEEKLDHITLGAARRHVYFKRNPGLISLLGVQRRTSSFISTDRENNIIKIHQDTKSDVHKGSGGRARQVSSRLLPRTVISTATAAEAPTALLARREMQSWRLLQLEPSAMRAPDPYIAPQVVAENGAHLPATMARLTGIARSKLYSGSTNELFRTVSEQKAKSIKQKIVESLSTLIDGVDDVYVDQDEKRELFSLIIIDNNQTKHEARSLSDGTLRFLALALIANDPDSSGLVCMEEPENGIHPTRIPSILTLLKDVSKAQRASSKLGPILRQVIINTHSPIVVALLSPEDILFSKPIQGIYNNKRIDRAAFIPLEKTWRSRLTPDSLVSSKGEVIEYLNVLATALSEGGLSNTATYVGLVESLPFVELQEEQE
ncbi:AAA family ATPase [Geothrix sp. 21YS21S-4]|uniref:AAA family ATPase n=1 Tax=Geothrix sp. 21YS21S-4 TaxID=3068889 RepID=UPI0027B99CD1|nr:AAA family ATPase [Geothrix sp. 21YS21S-4]